MLIDIRTVDGQPTATTADELKFVRVSQSGFVIKASNGSEVFLSDDAVDDLDAFRVRCYQEEAGD